MNEEQVCQALYDKMKAEQDDYRDWLLSQPPEEILQHAYEYSVREDILSIISGKNLPSMAAKALLHAEQPLASVYTNWSKRDYGIYEDLVEVVQEWSNKELQESPSFMEICVYQIDLDRDQNRIAFFSSEKLAKFQGSDRIDSSLYNSVFHGVVECTTLEDIYHLMNFQHPPGYMGRSMSTSDVVQVIHSTVVEPGFYYCESIGFSRIDFDPELTQNMTRAIPVLLLEPGKLAKPILVNNTLEAKQQLVGGPIEVIPLQDNVQLICNEEGKLLALPPNRALKNEDGKVQDVLVGTCLICGSKDGEFIGLTPEQMKHYKKEFLYPQKCFQRNGEIVVKDIKPHNMER